MYFLNILRGSYRVYLLLHFHHIYLLHLSTFRLLMASRGENKGPQFAVLRYGEKKNCDLTDYQGTPLLMVISDPEK